MPFRKITLEEDEAIKRLSSSEETPKRFNWEEALSGDDGNKQNVRLSSGEGERTIGLTEIANTVGNALAILLLSKGEEDVFTNENRDFVAKVTRAVGDRFNESALGQAENGGLSENEFHRGIERVLIENNAHDVARSLVFDTSRRVPQSDEQVSVRLIRRNNQVVSWNQNKIEIAIRKAFLSQEKDSAPAVHVAEAVTDRV
ncbi:MAG TPA: ribonucleoside-diphosphate reductase subunit alpha, partial [Verrucomicrobiales bacterium]|nr:ribonucleoside-diphosphate reductase subunit alpha [Verrucomicrobiales bacterium]